MIKHTINHNLFDTNYDILILISFAIIHSLYVIDLEIGNHNISFDRLTITGKTIYINNTINLTINPSE